VDGSGNLYVADGGNQLIRKITPAGQVLTIAGSPGIAGETNGVGSNAIFHSPYGVAVDASGNIYVVDAAFGFNSDIRKITPAGVVTTIASLISAQDVAVDAAGNLYATAATQLYEITPSGAMTVIAGGANPGNADGVGTNAAFRFLGGIAVDGSTNLYVTDNENDLIRMIKPVVSGNVTNWVVSTIAGFPGGGIPYSDGVGTNATFNGPQAISVDAAGSLYVADTGNNAARKITPVGTNWVVTTIGGSAVGTVGSADGTGGDALFNQPLGIAVDTQGNVYVADTLNNTIRKGIFAQYGTANRAAYIPPPQTGSLQVTLLPAEANGQWRFPWEVAWHESAELVTNLAAGNYPVEFRNLPGWLAIPAELTVTNPAVVLAGGMTAITNNYYPTVTPTGAGAAAGSLTVSLGANPPAGSGWRFLGDTGAFFVSNFTTNLLPGTYLIEFAGPFPNRATPPNASVQVAAEVPTLISVNYPFAGAPPAGAVLPSPVPAGEIAEVTDFPFGFNGRLQSGVGFGSGAVVQSNVVLTAAHLLFDDVTESYVGGAYWFGQEEAPAYVPTP
jgi:sugar lactone lactonase YvrE